MRYEIRAIQKLPVETINKNWFKISIKNSSTNKEVDSFTGEIPREYYYYTILKEFDSDEEAKLWFELNFVS